MKTLKTISKSGNSKRSLAKWIASQFPENYCELTYVEPYCIEPNVLFVKNKSYLEVLNYVDGSLIDIYRALRDEPKEMAKKLTRFKYCEDAFLKMQKKQSNDDYLDGAVSEYVLRKMSRGELKKTFSKSIPDGWKESIKDLKDISDRLQEVFIFNNKPLEIITTFNSADSLIYCCPPYLYENKKSKTVYSSEITTDAHIQLSHLLNSFRGKVVISGATSPLYSRLYKNWNFCKSKLKNKTQKVEVIWKNF